MITWRRIFICLLLLALVSALGVSAWLGYRLNRYHTFMSAAGEAYGVDPRLLSCVIWRESRFNSSAVGRAGEQGLMQVTSIVGWEWAGQHGIDSFSEHDLLDPETNIHAGAWYLATALGHWTEKEDPLPYALAQYNAGRSNALRWAKDDQDDPARFIDQITYPSTHAYVTDILKRYRGRQHLLSGRLQND